MGNTFSENGQLNLRYSDGRPFFLSFHQAKLIFALVDGPLTRDEVREIYFPRRKAGEALTKVQRASMARSLRRILENGSIVVEGDVFTVDPECRKYFRGIRDQFAKHLEGTKEDFDKRFREFRVKHGMKPKS